LRDADGQLKPNNCVNLASTEEKNNLSKEKCYFFFVMCQN